MDDILTANMVLISDAGCPSNEYTIDKGPEWPSFDLQPISVHFLVVHDEVYVDSGSIIYGQWKVFLRHTVITQLMW